MSASVRSFPNVSTQFQPGIGGGRKGVPRPAIGKRRVKRLKAAIALVEAVHGPPEPFEGTSLDWVRAVRDGRVTPNPVQLQAGLAALSFEHPKLAAVALQAVQPEAQMSPTERARRIHELLGKLDKPLLEGVVEHAPDPIAPLRQRALQLEAKVAEIDDPEVQKEFAEVRAMLDGGHVLRQTGD